MITLLRENFKPLEVTKTDLAVASIAWGFTVGFGFFTAWTATKQTTIIRRRYGIMRLNSPYVWMICFLFFFSTLTTWALEAQFLLQIIINRISILLTDRRKAKNLKIWTAVLITAITISVYCIWIPARLQTSERFIYINSIWDRCEKVIYLLVDAALNAYFILTVQRRFVRHDLLKFHPLAYIVKLNIEMSMADLIVKISNNTNDPPPSSLGTSLAHRNNYLSSTPTSKSLNPLFRRPGNPRPNIRKSFLLNLDFQLWHRFKGWE
ncbi:hypothetical protein G7Y89_g15842 [Cudoniella acicularis]|uniref:Uncharacterized protein n=1 Tax=Cudoniella acicularis TaxID=354080 RepID=A0A8H4VHR9_9HELO|nr:hypothetical protein G7Y89_g15842 [Cudoniella acicularis]